MLLGPGRPSFELLRFYHVRTNSRPSVEIFIAVFLRPAGCNSAAQPNDQGGLSCASTMMSISSPAFETSSKRRKSFPSETHVKRGHRFVHGNVQLIEKLGRNDLCPCASGRKFQGLLPQNRKA